MCCYVCVASVSGSATTAESNLSDPLIAGTLTHRMLAFTSWLIPRHLQASELEAVLKLTAPSSHVVDASRTGAVSRMPTSIYQGSSLQAVTAHPSTSYTLATLAIIQVAHAIHTTEEGRQAVVQPDSMQYTGLPCPQLMAQYCDSIFRHSGTLQHQRRQRQVQTIN